MRDLNEITKLYDTAVTGTRRRFREEDSALVIIYALWDDGEFRGWQVWVGGRLVGDFQSFEAAHEASTVCFRHYRRKQIAELRQWTPDYDMKYVSVSSVDLQAGSPKPGDMIARNPKNHDDQWLVAKQYFEDNFEEM